MILNFHGGARPKTRTLYGKQKIKTVDACSAVCIPASENSSLLCSAGALVARGTLLGSSFETPVYSPISGQFRGIAELEGAKYFVVIGDGEGRTAQAFPPETRAITDLSLDDITECARKLAIFDSRTGQPLWKMLQSAQKCRRIVIDCTEPDAASAISYRLCLEKAKSLVGGAKILLRATDALKCVFTLEHYRKNAIEEIAKYATDEKLFAAAELDEKYPYLDLTIMHALYLKNLAHGETPLDHGIFIVGIEAAVALYDAMLSGIPQLDRYISYCTKSLANGGNLCVPRGITLREIIKQCGVEKNTLLIENSLLFGRPVGGALSDKTRALITASPKKAVRAECISCGKCIEACPARLYPNDVLFAKDNRRLKKLCVECGACSFVCPSGIPLLDLIRENKFGNKQIINPETEVQS